MRQHLPASSKSSSGLPLGGQFVPACSSLLPGKSGETLQSPPVTQSHAVAESPAIAPPSHHFADLALHDPSASPSLESPQRSPLRTLSSPSSSPIIQRQNRIESYTATDELHPLSVLEDSFSKQKANQAYSVKAGGGAISLSQFYNKGQKTLSRPTQVIAILDGACRTPGTRKSDPIQSAMGNIGDHERAIMGRSAAKSYEGGHLISDTLLGTDSYVEHNFAPQLADVNAPIYRNVEELAEKGLIDKTTLTPVKGGEIKMEVNLSYADDPYKVQVADLIKQSVIPSSFTQTDTGGTDITFPRRVPWKWEANLSFDMTKFSSAIFQEKDIGPAALTSFVGLPGNVNPKLRRMGSQENLWGMASAHQDASTGKNKVGGGTTEHFAAYQAIPEPLTQQTAFSGSIIPPTRTVPVVSLPSVFPSTIKVINLDDPTSADYKLFESELGKINMVTLAKEIARVIKQRKKLNSKIGKITKEDWRIDLQKLNTKKNKTFAQTRLLNDPNMDLSP